MKNLKINMKLLLGFGIILFMLIICSGVAIFNMNIMGSQVSQYANRTLPNTESVWEMRRDMISIERYLLSAIIEDNQDKKNQNIDMAAKDGENLISTMEAFKKNSMADKGTMASLADRLNEIKDVREGISDLIRNGENDKAYDLFVTGYVPLFDECATILLDIAADQNQRAEEQNVIAQDAFRSGEIILIVTALLAVLSTLAVMSIIKKSILVPIKEIHEAAKSIAKGDLSTTISYESKDELGQLSNAMKTLVFTVVQIIKDLDYCLKEIGNGNFTVDSQIKELYVGDFASLERSMNHIMDQLSSTLAQINISSDQVAIGSEQVSSGAQALSQGTTEQASSIEELSATINEITEKIDETASNVKDVKDLIDKTGNEVNNSNLKMQEMIHAMDDISGKSNDISKIIKTIDDIAFQTNILALNAAVEAARAGNAGKGFAVVADEVRNLAQKSATAAKNTTELIEGSIIAVSSGVKIAGETAQSLEVIVENAGTISERIEEINSASMQEATGAKQIATGIEQIAAVIQTNSATAEESAAASEELSGQAQLLKDLVARFKLREEIQYIALNEESHSF